MAVFTFPLTFICYGYQMENKNDITGLVDIERRIFIIRDQKVMLDFHLARLYGVLTKRLNEQVKRNLGRFPSDFMFQLTKEEVVAICDHLPEIKFSYKSPYAFTEHGVAMLSSVLQAVIELIGARSEPVEPIGFKSKDDSMKT